MSGSSRNRVLPKRGTGLLGRTPIQIGAGKYFQGEDLRLTHIRTMDVRRQAGACPYPDADAVHSCVIRLGLNSTREVDLHRLLFNFFATGAGRVRVSAFAIADTRPKGVMMDVHTMDTDRDACSKQLFMKLHEDMWTKTKTINPA